MERYLAIVEAGIVSNIIVVNPDDAVTIDHFGGLLLPEGSPVAIGWTYDGVEFAAPVVPPIILTLEETKVAKLAEMEAAYIAAVGADITYVGKTFQADTSSQALIASVLTASGGTLPVGFVWYDSSNQPVEMSFAALQGLAGSILLRGQPLFIKKQTKKEAVRAAATIAAVEAITW